MERFFRFASGLALLSVAFLCLAVGFAALKVKDAALSAVNGVQHSLLKLDGDLDEAHRTLEISAKVANDSRVSLDNVNKAAIDERFYLEHSVPALTGSVQAALDSAMIDAEALGKTERAATATLVETRNRLAELEPVEKSANLLIVHSDALVSDPAIHASLSHLDAMSASGARAAQHLDGTTADVQTAVHSYLHPGWRTRVVNWTMSAVHALGGWF